MADFGRDLVEKYKNYVSSNPETATNIESGLRIISYVYPGSNPAVSELLYAAGNLLGLLNDALLRQARNIAINIPVYNQTLATWLAILEHVEVFLEITGQTHSDHTRWFIVVCVQILKAAIRFVMLYKYKSGVQISPFIPSLNRKKELSEDMQSIPSTPLQTVDQPDLTFTLNRSGRKIRALHASPPLMNRDWKLPTESSSAAQFPTELGEIPLTRLQTVGETLHILRPLIHLLGVYRSGAGLGAWRPWVAAAGVDAASVYCLRSAPRPPAEDAEIRRRSLMLALYLLRSPFYDKVTRSRLEKALTSVRGSVPLSRLIVNPILDYLPYWQRIYAYNWMS